MSGPISPGSRVTLHFTLTLEDGTVAETSVGGEPLTFTMGDGTLIRGLELALYGLDAGEHQRLRLDPEQAFGLRDPANVHPLPREAFPADMALAPGTIVGFTTPEGDELAGAVREVAGDQVTVDFNHPLAGQVIDFAVEILDVEGPERADDEDDGGESGLPDDWLE